MSMQSFSKIRTNLNFPLQFENTSRKQTIGFTFSMLCTCVGLFLITFDSFSSSLIVKDTTIHIRAVGGLQFDIVRFKVKPATKVKIILENDDDMAHNLVIVKPESRMVVVQAALSMGADGPKEGYVPKIPEVLNAIALINPGETNEITFTAPEKEGIYPYVCTYPGHGYVMYGVMYVSDKEMPLLTDDTNIPPSRQVKTSGVSPEPHEIHPYPETRPFLYRTFMPNCSPAAIAVGLPGDLSYCWDASSCRLRYAWKGGFIDNMPHWAGNGNAIAKVIGEVFYTEKLSSTLSFYDASNTAEFLGYILVDGYPQFEYKVGAVTVNELIKELPDASGLERRFNLSGVKRKVKFRSLSDDKVTFSSNKGRWHKGNLTLTRKQAQSFVIQIKNNKGEE